MAKVKDRIEFLGFTSDGTVSVSINGQEYLYTGVDIAVYNKRVNTYKYKPGKLLNWLAKNSGEYSKCVSKTRKDPSDNKPIRGPEHRARREEELNNRSVMIKAFLDICKAQGYSPYRSPKSLALMKCPMCKRMSVVRARRRNKGAFVCLHKYDPTTNTRCKYKASKTIKPK